MNLQANGSQVDIRKLVKSITRSAVVAVVFLVFLLANLAAPEMNGETLRQAAVKALLAGVLGQIFLLIIADTVVRSIVSSAQEARASRREGGLLFHFLKPDPDEARNSGHAKPRRTGAA